MNKWKLIETAPKDGSIFLGYGTAYGDYGYTEDEELWVACKYDGKNFVPAGPTGRYFNGMQFTHWHEPPKF